MNNKVHLGEYAPKKSTSGLQTINEFAESYGWHDSAGFVLERLQSLGFPYLSRLDHITKDAQRAFAKSCGYDDFGEFETNNKQDSTPKQLDKRTLREVAAILELEPHELFTKLVYLHVKRISHIYSNPVRLVVFANACNLSPSTVIKLIKSTYKNEGKSFNNYTEITDLDIEALLRKIEAVKWGFIKYLPRYLSSYADQLMDDKKKEGATRFLSVADQDKQYENDLQEKYQQFSLPELGKIYNNGKNNLDSIENDVVKKVIVKKMKEK